MSATHAESAPRPPSPGFRLPRMRLLGIGTVLLTVCILSLRFAVPAYRQQAAIRELERRGARVTLHNDHPAWLPERFVETWGQLFGKVEMVAWYNPGDNEGSLAALSALTDLELLYITDTPIGKSELSHLRPLHKLKLLHLDGTKVADADVAHLQRLPSLRELSLANTPISDAGLAHLATMTQLEQLCLNGTTVTADGLSALKELPRLEFLNVRDTPAAKGDLSEWRRATKTMILLQ